MSHPHEILPRPSSRNIRPFRSSKKGTTDVPNNQHTRTVRAQHAPGPRPDDGAALHRGGDGIPTTTSHGNAGDVVQNNWKTGEVVFEQHGAEFPDFWSVNASTIVTTKYFRGAVGTESREWSLKQLIDRVVLTYTKSGRDNGYFRSDEDAEIFEHELTYMLLHQVFSFNSPVWFNVGTTAPQQVSACFILSVDDTMDSILNWYKEEGFIFKGGSGAGAEPVAYPFEQGALAILWWHSVRARVVHARGGRLRGHDQVRWCYSSGGEDGGA